MMNWLYTTVMTLIIISFLVYWIVHWILGSANSIVYRSGEVKDEENCKEYV